MKRFVLDASALISFFEDRSGGEVIEKLVAECVAGKTELFMSVVNWGEVYYSTWRAHGQVAARQTAGEISQFPIQVMSADWELTKSAADCAQNTICLMPIVLLPHSRKLGKLNS